MKRKYRRIQLVSCCLLLFFITGCCGLWGSRHPGQAKDFPREISRLERMARYHPEVSVRARSHLDLAFLYLNPKNPELDYGRAIQEMTHYVSLNPTGTGDETVLDWIAALKHMARLRQENMELGKRNQGLQTRAEKLQAGMEKALELNRTLREEVSGLHGANHNLKETNQNLNETNRKMLETIESLKALDAQMEEKRRRIK